jgi:hypothetical protein
MNYKDDFMFLPRSKKMTAILVGTLLSWNIYAIPSSTTLTVNNTYIKHHGRIITGTFTGTLTQPAISVQADIPVIIRDATLQGPGDLIYVSGGDVTVENTTGIATNPNVAGVQKGMFVSANFVKNLKVSNCTIQGVRFGVYVNGYTGDKTSKQIISIVNNTISDIDGRPSDGNNGYVLSGDYMAHGIQLNQVAGVPNIEIAWNKINNTFLQSQSSDLISIYDSSGTSDHLLLIHDNYLQGAYPANPGVDKSYFGSGISLDGSTLDTPNTTTSYTSVYNNHIVSVANAGIQIKAGHNNTENNNRIISSGRLANGNLYGVSTAVGLNNTNFYQQAATVFFSNTISNNTVGLVTVNASGAAVRADLNLPGQNNAVMGNTIFLPNDNAHPTLIDEANELSLWQAS